MNQSDTQQTTELVIERVVDAPLQRVWEAWTDPEQMKKWWGPKDFTAPSVEIDLKEGGKYLNCMRSPDGQEYWSTGIYQEIVPMEKLVVTDSFADEQGNVVVYQGVPFDLTPDTGLYRERYVSNLQASQLSPEERAALFDHELVSYDRARARVAVYEAEAVP